MPSAFSFPQKASMEVFQPLPTQKRSREGDDSAKKQAPCPHKWLTIMVHAPKQDFACPPMPPEPPWSTASTANFIGLSLPCSDNTSSCFLFASTPPLHSPHKPENQSSCMSISIPVEAGECGRMPRSCPPGISRRSYRSEFIDANARLQTGMADIGSNLKPPRSSRKVYVLHDFMWVIPAAHMSICLCSL